MFRKILLSTVALVAVSGTALAADLPSRAEPPVYLPPPPIFTWTGVYVGGQIGYEWGREADQEFTTATGLPDGFNMPFKTDGVVGGAHLGYNYQAGFFVLGAEVDVNGTGNKGGFNIATGSVSSRESLESSFRARAGLAFDRILVFATGGGALAGFQHTYTNPAGVSEAFENSRFGWTVGGGIDYAITNNWSVGAEYRYTDFGSFRDVSIIAFPGFTERQHPKENEVLVSISYKFGEPPAPAPVIAKY